MRQIKITTNLLLVLVQGYCQKSISQSLCSSVTNISITRICLKSFCWITVAESVLLRSFWSELSKNTGDSSVLQNRYHTKAEQCLCTRLSNIALSKDLILSRPPGTLTGFFYLFPAERQMQLQWMHSLPSLAASQSFSNKKSTVSGCGEYELFVTVDLSCLLILKCFVE